MTKSSPIYSGNWRQNYEQPRSKVIHPMKSIVEMHKVAALIVYFAAFQFASGILLGVESDSAEPTSYRGSYFKNGEIHVNTYGTPEGKPLTRGHHDFKSSW